MLKTGFISAILLTDKIKEEWKSEGENNRP